MEDVHRGCNVCQLHLAEFMGLRRPSAGISGMSVSVEQ